MYINLNGIAPSKLLQEAEAYIIEYTLLDNQFNQTRTAQDLGISRGNLRMKLKEYWGDKYFKNKRKQQTIK